MLNICGKKIWKEVVLGKKGEMVAPKRKQDSNNNLFNNDGFTSKVTRRRAWQSSKDPIN
jgi:hypothetical protein